MLRTSDVLMALEILKKENEKSSAYDKMYELALKQAADVIQLLPEYKIDESVWIDAKLKSPKKSGIYLAKWHCSDLKVDYWHYSKVLYSKKYNLWNSYDEAEPEEAAKYEIKIDYWTEVEI